MSNNTTLFAEHFGREGEIAKALSDVFYQHLGHEIEIQEDCGGDIMTIVCCDCGDETLLTVQMTGGL